MRIWRDQTTRPSRRLMPAASPVRTLPRPPPGNSRTYKQLTAPADRPVRDRPVRDVAHADSFTTAVAIRGAGSVARRTGMPTAGHSSDDPGRPAPARGHSHHSNHQPALPATQLPATPTTILSTCTRVQGGNG